MKFCFKPRVNVGETDLMMQKVYKDGAVGKIHMYLECIHFKKAAMSVSMINPLLVIVQLPEETKMSREFV